MSLAAPQSETEATRRDDPSHYTLTDLPPEFAAFETAVDGLGVGQPGKVGLLDLGFALSGEKTRVIRHFQQFPLHVFRPIYLDPYRPEMAFAYIMSHGGTVQGDRYRLDLTCAPGASAHITTQSATKLYRMDVNYATQFVRLTAAADSFLEYMPDPVVPFRGTRFCGRTSLTAHESATVILGEILLPGRVAHGENHDYTIYATHLEACSSEGDLWFCDSLKFAPDSRSPQSPGRLGPFAALANLYVISRRVAPHSLSARLHARLAQLPEVMGGASELPNGRGVWVRVLGAGSIEVSAALHAAWDEARLALIGVPAPIRRKT